MWSESPAKTTFFCCEIACFVLLFDCTFDVNLVGRYNSLRQLSPWRQQYIDTPPKQWHIQVQHCRKDDNEGLKDWWNMIKYYIISKLRARSIHGTGIFTYIFGWFLWFSCREIRQSHGWYGEKTCTWNLNFEVGEASHFYVWIYPTNHWL